MIHVHVEAGKNIKNVAENKIENGKWLQGHEAREVVIPEFRTE